MNTKLAKSKTDSKFLFEFLSNLKCGGLTLFDDVVLISRDKVEKKLNLKIGTGSDLKIARFERRSISINHKKFDKKSGHLELNFIRNDESFGSKFHYTRELDENTNKLSKGNYKLETQFGAGATKSCELNIESKTNYYNKLSCQVKTAKLPVKLSYGYSLKVNF